MDAGGLQRAPAARPKVDFVLMGFDQEAEVRLYAFRRVDDKTRASFTVGVDLALLPNYGIKIQELPLLCREVLERRSENEGSCALTLTEAEMRVHSEDRKTAQRTVERKRKSARTPSNDRSGVGWQR